MMAQPRFPKWASGLPALAAWLLLGPPGAWAAEAPAGQVADYFRLIWGLLVVLGVILILYGLLRKRFSLLTAGTSQEIRIVELKPLMGKKALCLVNVRGQAYLLGLGHDRITHLATLPPEPEDSFAKVLQATGARPKS